MKNGVTIISIFDSWMVDFYLLWLQYHIVMTLGYALILKDGVHL